MEDDFDIFTFESPKQNLKRLKHKKKHKMKHKTKHKQESRILEVPKPIKQKETSTHNSTPIQSVPTTLKLTASHSPPWVESEILFKRYMQRHCAKFGQAKDFNLRECLVRASVEQHLYEQAEQRELATSRQCCSQRLFSGQLNHQDWPKRKLVVDENMKFKF